MYTAVQESFVEISPEGRKLEGDISTKLLRTAVYTLNNHYVSDKYRIAG